MKQGDTLAQIAQALGTVADKVFLPTDGKEVTRAMAVGCSGGLDSSVLLYAAQRHAAAHGIRLHAFHIHHGLSDQADAWEAHVRRQAAQHGIAFDTRRIDVAGQGNGTGTEDASRTGRYAALGALCREHDVPLLLVAHHQDDQAETVLLQLLRGSGVAGLSGMDTCNTAPSLLGHATLWMARPMLALSRSSLVELATECAIDHVEDPSNTDPRFARNALRHQVMPVLEAAFPGFAQRFARSAQHAQAAQALLISLAQEDLVRCADGDALLLSTLRQLDAARIDNLLRYWFGRQGKRMPSTAWLAQLRSQLFGARPDAQILVIHPDCELHRHRDRIVMTERSRASAAVQAPLVFEWDGSDAMAFPTYGGTLHFDAAEEGLDAVWLRAQRLALQWRSAGFRLKPAANRATRSLKYHYQAADIPAWERARLPLVTLAQAPTAGSVTPMAADDSALLALGLAEAMPDNARPLPPLLYAAGIGMECHYFAAGPGSRVVLRWEGDRHQPD